MVSPTDATPEEVSYKLFGSTTEAFRLENAHPLYGAKPRNLVGDFRADDPVKDVANTPLGDEIALNQANTIGGASKKPRAAVIAQIRFNAIMLETSVKAGAKKFGLSDSFRLLAESLNQRAARLETAGDAEVAKWDVQSQAQAKIISQGSKGLETTGQRLAVYAEQYGADLRKDPGAFGLPDEHRQALRKDAELWTDAIAASDTVTSAEQRLQVAALHSKTLEIEILERGLASPQAAVHNAQANPSEGVKEDFDPASLEKREMDQRAKLGAMRANLLAKPETADPTVGKTSEENRDLVFESRVILQAESVDSAWSFLDDADGFWARVTFDHGDLQALKSEGKGYYNQWREVYRLIKAGDKVGARKAYETLCSNKKLHTFLKRVNEAVMDAQKHALIAKLIAMIVITIASMGAGIFVEGLVGGGAAAAGAAEGTAVVTAGLGYGRTAGMVAGFLTEATTFTLASNFALEKDHSVGHILTEFGKNLILSGALRGVSTAFKAAGLAKVVETGAKEGASFGAVAKGTAVTVSEAVIGGGVGVIAAIVEAKIKEKLGGKPMTDEELKQTVLMTVAQTIIMVIVGRLMKNQLKDLKAMGAMSGTKIRNAKTLAAKLEALTGQHDGKPITQEQLEQINRLDREQLLAEREAFEAAREDMAAKGKDTKSIDAHIKELKSYEDAAATIDLMINLKQEAAGHYHIPREKSGDLVTRHKSLGSTVEVASTDKFGAKTYSVTTKTGEVFFITEQLPEWAMSTSGQRIVKAAQRAGIDDHLVFELTASEREAILAIERASETKNDVEVALARSKLKRFDKAQQDALIESIGKGREEAKAQAVAAQEAAKAKEDPEKAKADAEETARLAKIRAGTGKVRGEADLKNADVVESMNAQLQNVKVGEIDAMVGKFPADQQARVRTVLARSSGFGKMEGLNSLRTAMEPHLKAGKKLYTPGQGSLADNMYYLDGEKHSFDATHAKPTKPQTTLVVEPNSVVILDQVVLAKMNDPKTGKEFAKSLVTNKVVLLEPRGFVDGNNMYNSGSPEVIAQRAEAVLKRATEIEAAQKIPFDEAVGKALDETSTKAIEKQDPAVAAALKGQLHVVDPAAHADVSSAAIADQVNSAGKITEGQLEAALAKVPEAERPYLRELLAQQAEIFSPRRQGNELAVQGQKILDLASTQGIPKDKVFYFIPKAEKSYGMVAMAHREATGTPVDHYIEGPTGLKDAIAKGKIDDASMLVILDDVAGSGDSLVQATGIAKSNGYKGKLAVSPIVSTGKANDVFNGPGGVTSTNSNVTYVPGRIAPAFKETAYYKSLSPAEQKHLEEDVLRDLGYDQNGLSTAFPYMAPDNNNRFFGGEIAREYVVNRNNHPDAVKTYKPWDPR